MMLRAFFAFLLIIAIHPTPVHAQTPDENIKKVLELSGLNKQIELLPAQIKSGFDQEQQGAQRKLTPEEYDRLLKIMMDAYNASDLKQSMVDYFKEHYDHDQISAELKILNSPLSKKMTELEIQASTPEATQEIQKYVEQLKSKPPPPERGALARKLDQLSGSTDTSVEVLVAMFLANIRVYNAISPPEQRIDDDQLKQMADRMRKELRKPIEDFTTASILYMYRTVPDTELKEYITLYEGGTAEWFKPLVKGALINAVSIAAEKAASKAAQKFPKVSA